MTAARTRPLFTPTPVSIRKYLRQLAFSNWCFWGALLWWTSLMIFRWLQKDGRVSCEQTFFWTIWSSFFLAFLGTGVTLLHPRVRLLLGRLEPIPAEWKILEQLPARDLSGSFWKVITLVSIGLPLLQGALVLLLHGLTDHPGDTRRAFQFHVAGLPALLCGLLSFKIARYSIQRFVVATERAAPWVINRRRYLWAHNVLPYTAFTTTAGTVAAVLRFWLLDESRAAIPIQKFVVHMTVTSFVVAAFAVGSALLKTRTDFLGPLILEGPRPPLRKIHWHQWYAVFVPALVYGGLKAAFGLLTIEEISPAWAIGMKFGMCLLISLTVSYWAVSSTLTSLEVEGLEAHRFVKVRRLFFDPEFLKTKGNP